MENPEEILHSLEEFAKLKPKDIPRELEDYLCFVAKTGDPVYQWSAVKSLFREKLISVITEFYESCPIVEIPPCPNVELFNYDSMKSFILEKLDTFAAAPFTVQRICELLTTPRKEYNRIDKYMRALEKNILVVSTTEPGNRRNTENGEGIVNGIETEHLTEANSSNDINVEEMDDSPSWPRISQQDSNSFVVTETSNPVEAQPISNESPQDSSESITPNESRLTIPEPSTSNTDSVITCTANEKPFLTIEPVEAENKSEVNEDDVNITITAIPAQVQKRRDSIEPLASDDNAVNESVTCDKEEETVKETTTENKSDITLEETTTPNFESIPLTVDSEKIKDNSDIEGKALSEESLSECAETIKDTEKPIEVVTTSDEVKTEDLGKEESIEDSPTNESQNQENCDSTQSVENTNELTDDSKILLPEPAVDEIPKLAEPNIEAVEINSKPEESVKPSSDPLDDSLKESCHEDNLLSVEEKADTTNEEPLNETPMEIDPDENLQRESSNGEKIVDTNSN